MQKNGLKNYKKLFTVLFLVLLCSSAFARSGMLWGEKKLMVVKTRWFDIIYPERCEASAAILYEKADEVYDEVTAQYGLTPAFRMPVVITPAVEQFNAFWTAVPYNHIAIYDTGVSGKSELAVFSETLLSTFRHELTHAVTYNMKDKAWQLTGKILGDCITPGMLTVTTGMAEGATLPSESAAGEGRLNDEYAKHYVKQAKIEGNFPSYHDVSGAADVSPGGSPYYFNGAFHQWLQEKYGLQAYAQFWFRVVNGKNFTISGAFKKAFGIKLKTAWKLFVEEYEVPSVAANPVKAGVVQDFFEPSGKEFSLQNDAGSLYTSLSSCTIGDGTESSTSASRLVWFDRFGGQVFSLDLPSYYGTESTPSASDNQKPRHLFSMHDITSVRISNDGRLLAVNYFSENEPGSKSRAKIYDINRGTFYSVRETGLKESAVVAISSETGTDYYLVSQKYGAQHYAVSISKIVFDFEGRNITSLDPVKEIVLPLETNPFAFTPLKDGTFAFVKKSRMQYSVCVCTVEGEQLREFAFPDGMVVRSLSSEDGLFIVSYAKKGTLPRLGFMEAESGELWLSSEDISGGVFEPVLYNGTVVYIGEFYRQNRLLCMRDVTTRDFDMGEFARVRGDSDGAENSDSPFIEPVEINENKNVDELPSTVYSPLPYLLRGIFIPVSSYQTEYFGINANYNSNAGNSYIGATYITANPWTEGTSDLYMLTAGWNALSKAFGIDLQITKGTSTSLFSSVTDLKSEFDSNGWKQGGGKLTLSSNLDFGRFSSITFSNSSEAFIGKQDTRFPEIYENPSSNNYKLIPSVAFWNRDTLGITAPADNTFYYKVQNIAAVKYSNIRRAGPGRFEYQGLAASVSFGARYDSSFADKKDYMKAFALGGKLTLCIPHLLPFESKQGYTYNLPVRFNTVLFPSSSIYGYAQPKASLGRVIFDTAAETTVFSMDIQKAIPGITALYLNDFYISAGYAGTAAAGSATKEGFQNAYMGEYFKSLSDGSGYYLDSVYIKSALEFTPNIGLFAKPAYKIGLITTFSYVIHTPELIKPGDRIKLSLGLDVNF